MTGSAPAAGIKRERRRRSHIRTFTGCLQCRQRHVKCDETRPTCINCNRMHIACSAYSFIIDMQVSTPRSLEAARKRKNASAMDKKTRRSGSTTSRDDSSAHSSYDELSERGVHLLPLTYTLDHHAMQADDDGDETIPGQLILKPRLDKPVKQEQQSSPIGNHIFEYPLPVQDIAWQNLPDQSLNLPDSPRMLADEHFLSNFLINVSAVLLVYDRPHNANPYRFFFPFLAAKCSPLRDVMNALGALHLAHTRFASKDINLEVMAVSRYARAVKGLREKLCSGTPFSISDLATCLLLVFFEMMESNSNTWKLHLIGARQIYEGLYAQTLASLSSQSRALESALQIFLISTLGYLDVAASISSASRTQIPGAYWDSGAEWQYNLGVPSLNEYSRDGVPEDHCLRGIRAMRSRLMLIQSEAGLLAEKCYSGMPEALRPQAQSLFSRLEAWRSQLPEIFLHLDDDSSELFHPDSVEAAVSVRCCEQATTIYLHQIVGASTNSLAIQVLIDCILTAFQKHARDVQQLGMLWALFIAGSATSDAYQQTFIRGRMQSMRCFGMRNVDLALDILETVWSRQKQGYVETRWFIIQQELSCTLLLT